MISDFISILRGRTPGREAARWLRPGIVLAVLAISAYMGPRASEELIILILGGIAALVFMRVPMLGLLLLPIASFLIPFELGTGTQSSISVTMILIAILIVLWVMEMLVQQRNVQLYASRVIPPVIGFMIVAIIAFVTGQLPWFAFANQVSLAAQLGGLVLFILSGGAFLWISQHVTNLKWLCWSVWIYLGIGLFYLLGVLTLGDGISRFIVPDSTGSIFWVWMVALSASQAVFNKNLKGRWRILLALITFITLLNGWRNRQWASGWVPGIVAILVVLFMVDWRLGLFIGSLMAVIFVYFDPAGTLQEFFSQDQYSLFTRQEAWAIVLKNIASVNPILGLGPSNYYNYTPLFPILGYSVNFNSHNQYVDLVAQVGIVGLIMFAWLVFEIGWLGWRLKDHAAPGFERAYVIGALAGLAGTLAAGMLGDWIIPFVYNIGLAGFRTSVFAWLFMGGLVVIERLIKQRENQNLSSNNY